VVFRSAPVTIQEDEFYVAAEPNTPIIPVFDGHNDTLLDLAVTGRNFYERSETGHIDRVRAEEGGLVGGFFAIWVPSLGRSAEDDAKVKELLGSALDGITPTTEEGWISLPFAQQYTNQAIARFYQLAAGEGAITIEDHSIGYEIPADILNPITSAAELEENIENGDFSAILHFEGAEMIDENFYALETYYAAGLRSLGIVWSRPNRFGHGVPFAFPSTGDTGPGLTDAGKALVQACNELGILLDLSHLNEKGFWDVAELSDSPLVATHSNAHAIAPSSRNLTDKQLDAIKDSDGVVGLNYNCGFLRPDGAADTNTPLSVLVDHIDYLVDKVGIERVALGSDFDGALMPADLSDASKLPNLIAALRARGYDDDALRKIGYQNWIRVLELTWGI